MAEDSRAYPLVEALMKRSRLPYLWATTIIAAMLLLLLILAVYLDGTANYLLDWTFWRTNLDGIVLTTYILVVHIFM